MSRYDWPAPPRGHDDAAGRAAHIAQLRPPVTALAVPTATSASTAAAAIHMHDAYSGDQQLWFPIGPSTMTNGQAGGHPNVAGRIRDLQVEPTAGQRLYAASASGGVWFSGDAGLTWRPLDDFQQTPDRTQVGAVASALACGAIHVAWANAADDGTGDDVWVGTGELFGGAGPLPTGELNGIGFLHRTATGWEVVNGDAGPDSLRGGSVFRIAADPDPNNDHQRIAATSNGLYIMPTGATTWTRAAHWPDSGKVEDHRPLDVLLTRTGGNIRVWVAEWGHVWVAEQSGAAPLSPADLHFKEVHLDNVAAGRMQIAAEPNGATVYVLGRRPKTPAEVAAALKNDKTPVAHLWSLNAAAAQLNQVISTQLPGMPPALFMSTSDQSAYDMCITVHPTHPGLVYVGGAATLIGNDWNGALYRCDTTAAPMVPVLIGAGVHADDHVIRFGPVVAANAPRRDVWIGCDGGLFHSDSDGDPGTFTPRNEGLAVLQPGYVANHPTNPGIVAAGFQDNGTGVRVGDTVWRRDTINGDGGGLAWDPDLAIPQPHRYFRQYTGGDWSSTDLSFKQPVLRAARPNIPKSQQDENDAAQFYSGADVISLGPGDTHVAIGTTRVWYTRDWGVSWVTLPTGTDPRNGNPKDSQDVVTPQQSPDGSTCADDPPPLRPGIIAVKFAGLASTGDARLRVVSLYPGGMVWMDGTRPGGSTVAFTWTTPSKGHPLPTQVFRAPRKGDETDSYNRGANMTFLPAPGKVSDFCFQDANQGPLGRLYVTTTGLKDFSANTPGARMDTLWFFDGTGTWWPCGLRTDNPNGTWTGTRITAPALGVVVDPADPTIVYVATSVGVVRGVMKTIGGPSFSWTWQLMANGLPEAAVQDLAITRYGDIRLLRAALQARGVWETELSNPTGHPLTYVRVHPSDTRWLLPTALTGGAVVGEVAPRWDNSPDILVDNTASTPASATEFQLMQVRARVGLPTAPSAAVWLPGRTAQVSVLVHHRSSTVLNAGDVKVALLQHVVPAGGSVPITALWQTLVTAAPGNTPPAALPDDWTAATPGFWVSPDPAIPPIDARTPRAVTFNVTIDPTVPTGTVLVLLAVVMSTGTNNQISAADLRINQTTNATTVDQLVLSSPHCAAVTVELL
jgi:hypothetical protein